MTEFVPDERHLHESLIFLFNLKKTSKEAHEMLEKAYRDQSMPEQVCAELFERFENGKFERGENREKIENTELLALLGDDSTLSVGRLAEMMNVTTEEVSVLICKIGRIQKEGVWVPEKLPKQMMANRKTICESLFTRQKKKSFLHRIKSFSVKNRDSIQNQQCCFKQCVKCERHKLKPFLPLRIVI
ncbi:unnamed protein product [Caenorhabditis bovis]|uniref:Mos1 transposase HTH domain-containing protein n=1 Tax=Caenorhabditis bovis TaxID=2654633 RepID=A0A8S1F6X7_9PELO|nr:unnamed protein product [Caenorhabditis bovis]